MELLQARSKCVLVHGHDEQRDYRLHRQHRLSSRRLWLMTTPGARNGAPVAQGDVRIRGRRVSPQSFKSIRHGGWRSQVSAGALIGFTPMFNPLSLGDRQTVGDEGPDIQAGMETLQGGSSSTSSRSTSRNASPNHSDNLAGRAAKSMPLSRNDMRVTLRDPVADRLIPYSKIDDNFYEAEVSFSTDLIHVLPMPLDEQTKIKIKVGDDLRSLRTGQSVKKKLAPGLNSVQMHFETTSNNALGTKRIEIVTFHILRQFEKAADDDTVAAQEK
eukprot:scaffold2643_cov387-Prasinococcus_capsulatus_cf.AAC.13